MRTPPEQLPPPPIPAGVVELLLILAEKEPLCTLVLLIAPLPPLTALVNGLMLPVSKPPFTTILAVGARCVGPVGTEAAGCAPASLPGNNKTPRKTASPTATDAKYLRNCQRRRTKTLNDMCLLSWCPVKTLLR